MTDDNERWRKRAACRGKPIEWFFPARFTGKPYDEGKALCKQCPVTKQCLELAEMNVSTGDRFGLFGGLTPNERRAMRRYEITNVLWEGQSYDDV